VDIKEHFYKLDIPSHRDAQTNASGCVYYFLGNGLIQVAVQVSKTPSSGTPLGLLIMSPDRFGKKADSFTFHPEFGLERTMLSLKIGERGFFPTYGTLRVSWEYPKSVPTVVATWQVGPLTVREEFFCPTFQDSWLARVVKIENHSKQSINAELHALLEPNPKFFPKRVPRSPMILYEGVGFLGLTPVPMQNIKVESLENGIKFILDIVPGEIAAVRLHYYYTLTQKVDEVVFTMLEPFADDSEREWQPATQIRTNHPGLDHLFNVSQTGLRASVSASGKMDGSIWQYNREWVRDKAMVTVAEVMAGHTMLARVILEDLLVRFVSTQGDTIDSSEWRNPSEVELDQNGYLLYALWTYWMWTGDDTLIKEYWGKIESVADFPLQDIFQDKESRLLKNTREFWERHAAFGVKEGYELAHQVFAVVGLEKAAQMAKHIGRQQLAEKWLSASEEIKRAMLTHPKFRMIEDNHFIKRRLVSGEVQRTFVPPDKSILPQGVPLVDESIAYIEPDTSEALPIVLELVPAKSVVAKETLKHLEALWNQRWKGGGYGRYHVTSEPDSPGPWPFATLFVAQAYLELGDSEKVWRALYWLLNAQGGESGSWFEFYGPRPVPPFPQVGVVPWTWAEMVIFFVRHLLGVRPEMDKITIRPRLLTGLNEITARIKVHGKYINIYVSSFKDMLEAVSTSQAILNGKEVLDFVKGAVQIPFPKEECEVRIIL